MDRNRSCHTLLLAAAVLALAIAPAAAADYPASVKKAVNSIYGKEIQRHADVLASDAYEGREAGKLGAVMAGNYVARFFKAYGLKPLGENGSFFQSFSVRGASPQAGKLEDANTLEVLSARKGSAPRGFAYGKDFLPYVFSASVSAEGDVVFAGYGITAPEYGYDDYKGLKVEGCIVLVLSHEPQEDDGDSVFEGRKLTRHADPRVKAELAAKRGAAEDRQGEDPGQRQRAEAEDVEDELRVVGGVGVQEGEHADDQVRNVEAEHVGVVPLVDHGPGTPDENVTLFLKAN